MGQVNPKMTVSSNLSYNSCSFILSDAGGATSRILGGEVKPPHSQPWVVGIIFDNGDRIECGGTLISKKHVIENIDYMYQLGACYFKILYNM